MFGIKDAQKARKQALAMASTIRHRGPDWSGIFSDDYAVLAHERLSIVDVESGAQPLYDLKKGRVMAVNGEIYDHKKLRELLKEEHEWKTKSDCEVLLYLYDEFGPSFLEKIDGIFAFILYDQKTKEYLSVLSSGSVDLVSGLYGIQGTKLTVQTYLNQYSPIKKRSSAFIMMGMSMTILRKERRSLIKNSSR